MRHIAKPRTRAGRLIAQILLIALLGSSVGCYGRFPLTRAIYRLNGEVGQGFTDRTTGKVATQVVFWVFVLLPVYAIAGTGDAVVCNLIEFWTGEKLEIATTQQLDDGTVVTLAPSAGGREAVLTISKDGRILAARHITRVSEGVCEIRDADGRLTGKTIHTPEGDLVLADAQGNTVKTIPASDLASLAPRS